MDISPTALVRIYLPRLPGLLLACIAASLGRTENAGHQDVLTQVIIVFARPLLRTPARIARSQRVWGFVGWVAGWVMGLLGLVGLSWVIGLDGVRVRKGVVRVEGGVGTVKAEKERQGNGEEVGVVMGVREAVKHAFDVLCDEKHGKVECHVPAVGDVEVEWTTCDSRKGVDGVELGGCPEQEKSCKYTGSQENPVILYFHGGAHCLMDPTTHRWTTGTLAKLSSATVCSVRFRLSPQHPFPAALLDAFVTYLSLLSPQSFSRSITAHESISPSRIVMAGDSSGGSIASSLVLLLLTLSRHNVSIKVGSSTVRIPSAPCAGLALTSPWFDITRSLPSTSQNDRWDIIAPPPSDSASPPFPPDEAWPSHPPRAETYCSADICTHPLVSPIAATSEMWVGAPAVWVCCGWEGFTDEIEVFARRVYASSGEAKVWFEGWEGMPHCFGMMPWNRAGWESMHEWTIFCKNAVGGCVKRRGTGFWRSGTVYGAKREVMMEMLGREKQGVGYERDRLLTDEIVDNLMEQGRNWRIELEMAMVQTGKKAAL